MKNKALICLLFVASAAACRDSGGPDLSLRFDALPVLRDTIILDSATLVSRRPPPITAEGEGARITVRGYIETPCANERVRGSAWRNDDGAIRLLVRSVHSGDTCAFRTDPYTYEAVVKSDRAAQRVVVEHRRDARRRDGVVLDTALTLSPAP
jgi:hypothetical protein